MNNGSSEGLKALLHALRDNHDEDAKITTAIPDFHARCMELLFRYRALNVPCGIVPGMFVRIKEGTNPLCFAGQPEDEEGRPLVGAPRIPWIVLRKLDMSDPYDHLIVAHRIKNTPTSINGYRAEWLIATTPNDQRHLVLEIVSGDVLEPIPSSELSDL